MIEEQQDLLAAEVQKNTQLEFRISELERLVRQALEGNGSSQEEKQEKVILTPKARLEQNIPNPFEGTTRIDYFIPEASAKNSFLLISGADGKEIRRIKLQNSGNGSVSIEMDRLSKGTYFYSLIVDGKMLVTKSMLYIE